MAQFVQKPVRWASPFDSAMTDAEVGRIRELSPFSFMDEDDFPDSIPLHGILLNDSRIRRYRRGDIVIRKEEYGTSAYFVINGRLRAIVARDDPNAFVGHGASRRRGWFGALAQLWTNPRDPEVRHSIGGELDDRTGRRGDGERTQVFVHDPDALIAAAETAGLGAGALFGEVGALSRSPRRNTVFAETDVELLEIRYQGLRDLRRYDPGFREYVDDLYRDRSAAIRLRGMPIFRDLPPESLGEIIEAATFEAYGELEWRTSFRRIQELGHAERVQAEPVIVSQGNYLDELIVIGFGFARVSRSVQDVEYTLRFEKAGAIFGLDEIVANRRDGGQRGYADTLRAIGYVDVLRIPVAVLEIHLLPHLPDTMGSGKKAEPPPIHDRAQDFLEFLVAHRYINGRAAMVIDTEKCVRCDACVGACADAHGNNPRFVRHGEHFANIQIANACMHCTDAVCLIGCPTGAIHREPSLGRVVIDDYTCIGCATCANSCPYDNIRMVEIRDRLGNAVLDQDTHQPVVKATKCDLCVDQLGGPACQRACPHDALQRIDLSDVDSVARLAKRVMVI